MAKNNRKSNKPNHGGDKQFRDKGDRLQGRQMNLDKPPYRSQLNKSNSNKRQRREKEIVDSEVAQSRSNPIEFYTKYSKFVMDAATLPFARPVGTPVEIDDLFTYIVPGIMRIRFAPSIGISKNFSSAINRSSIRFYTYLRSNQKASAQYDHQDITMMMIALDSAYMFHALCSRVYKTINLFTPVNEYYARAVVAAAGFDFSDIVANLQDFRAYINSYAYMLGQFAMPADIEFFERHRWMCEGLYTDGTSTKAQTYIFVPEFFYKYDNTVETGSQCTAVQWTSQGAGASGAITHTYSQVREFGDALLNAFSGDEDFAVISGDIYNFYGGKTFTLPYVSEGDTILPSYDEIVLSQIENAMILGTLKDTTISQNPNVNQGSIIYTPSFTPYEYSDRTTLMNFHHDSPTPEEIIEATRLMVDFTYPAGSSSYEIISCGTEIVTGIDVYSRNPETMAYRMLSYDKPVISLSDDSTLGDVKNALTKVSYIQQFDWAPRIDLYASGFAGLTWDIENFDTVPGGYLDNIHLGCLLSLFSAGPNVET